VIDQIVSPGELNSDGNYDFTFQDSSKKEEFTFYPALFVMIGNQIAYG